MGMNYHKNISAKNFAAAALSALALAALSAPLAYAAATGGVKITGVVRDGTAHPSDFTLQIKNSNSTIEGSGDTLIFSGLSAGTYTVTKSAGPSGYSIVWSGDCNPQGSVTIVPNMTKQCVATYVFGPVGSIKVNTVIKGGTATASNFTVHLKKSGQPDTGSPSGSGNTVTFDQLTPGAYTVIESAPPTGYSVSWSGACDTQGNVTVAANATATCTVTNTFTPPPPPPPPPVTGGGDNSGRSRGGSIPPRPSR